MFYSQPLSSRFGKEFADHVDKLNGIAPYWDSLDVAVAWVRAAGVAHLSRSFQQFLKHSGSLRFVVGIDLQNTTKEGLQALLDLEVFGSCETYVYHNEADSVFHPKVYFFRNIQEARIIVGSNNLTQAGLYSNVEAGLLVDAKIKDSLVVQVNDAFDAWRDVSSGLAFRLTPAFLAQLVKEGYVPDEATVRSRRAGVKKGRSTKKLFASRRYGAPTLSSTGGSPSSGGSSKAYAPASPSSGTTPGSVLLMRLRKAHVTQRPTQAQIPIRLLSSFFKGVSAVTSAHTGQSHSLIKASARGSQNTVKLEIPEMRSFSDPLARFELTPSGIVYEVYDIGTPKGNQIRARLVSGQKNGSTQATITDLSRATWWRAI